MLEQMTNDYRLSIKEQEEYKERVFAKIDLEDRDSLGLSLNDYKSMFKVKDTFTKETYYLASSYRVSDIKNLLKFIFLNVPSSVIDLLQLMEDMKLIEICYYDSELSL